MIVAGEDEKGDDDLKTMQLSNSGAASAIIQLYIEVVRMAYRSKNPDIRREAANVRFLLNWKNVV